MAVLIIGFVGACAAALAAALAGLPVALCFLAYAAGGALSLLFGAFLAVLGETPPAAPHLRRPGASRATAPGRA